MFPRMSVNGNNVIGNFGLVAVPVISSVWPGLNKGVYKGHGVDPPSRLLPLPASLVLFLLIFSPCSNCCNFITLNSCQVSNHGWEESNQSRNSSFWCFRHVTHKCEIGCFWSRWCGKVWPPWIAGSSSTAAYSRTGTVSERLQRVYSEPQSILGRPC